MNTGMEETEKADFDEIINELLRKKHEKWSFEILIFV